MKIEIEKNHIVVNGVKYIREVKNELEVGKWYKYEGEKEFITFIKPDCRRYGIGLNGKWFCDANKINEVNGYYEATEQEVFEALKNEAVKRYKVGDYINCLHYKYLDKVYNLNFEISEDLTCIRLRNKEGYLGCVFDSGKWAEIIPTITKQEAEKQLNCKIV